ncbi:MAG TPA: PQQ-binding-like beta-propeller repeat protein [Gemmata sp.]|nr:PQQ-binding-like beta-propeller repeat protein [Gemmata sp.]
MRRLSAPALATLLLLAAPAPAVIMKLTPLAEILENDDYILVAAIDKLEPEKPLAVFKVEKVLKGKPAYDRIAVNMTGNDEAKKAGDAKTIFDRLDPSRKVVVFVGKRGKNHNAKVFVEGSWFSVHGTEDPADKTVRWAFLNGEPFLRRTFKGTTAEMLKAIEDGLAGKAKPPAPDEKEPKGYGPPAAVKQCLASGVRSSASDRAPAAGGEVGGVVCDSGLQTPDSALFAVIPSFALIGPLAVVAALFPGVFAKMAVGMKRWRAFLVVASAASTVACVYWALGEWWSDAIPSGWWGSPKALTLYLMVGTAVAMSWAGRRYRRMAAEDAAVTNLPTRTELYSLFGLTAAIAVVVVVVALFADWRSTIILPMREITFIGIATGVAALYAGYRLATRSADVTPAGTPLTPRLCISGELVGLGTLLLCWFTVLVSAGGYGAAATGGETGDADAIGPRFVGVKTFEVKMSHQVMSGITVAGDRLYFGAVFTRSSLEGQLICLDRESGEEKWRYEGDDDMLPVFCTPTVAGTRVYCGEGLHTDKGCRMFCVNAADGTPAWGKPFATTSHTEGAPAVLGDRVFFPAGDDGLIAAKADSGEELWRFKGGKDAGIHIDAAPAVGGGRVFVGSGLYSYVAVALDAATGKEVWRTDLKLRSFGAPLAAGKFVYYGVGTGNMGADVFDYPEEGLKEKEEKPAGAVVCLDAETGKEVWRYDLPRSVHTGLAGDAFSVYACCRDGNVYAFDRKTGKLRWSRGAGGYSITSGPAVATSGGTPVAVYAVSVDGNLVCLSPHTGAVVWQKRLPVYHYFPTERNDVVSGPVVVTTPTPTGSKRAVYVGAMVVDRDNYFKKSCAVFRFEDEVGGE